MQRRRTAVHEAWTLPVMGYLSVYLAFMAGIFVLLHWLLQPATIVNAGSAIYVPPPLTRLEPLPRKMDAPEVAELEAQSPLQALAKGDIEETQAPPPPVEPRRRSKKRQPIEAAPREPRRTYAAERNVRYRAYDQSWQRNYRTWW